MKGPRPQDPDEKRSARHDKEQRDGGVAGGTGDIGCQPGDELGQHDQDDKGQGCARGSAEPGCQAGEDGEVVAGKIENHGGQQDGQGGTISVGTLA